MDGLTDEALERLFDECRQLVPPQQSAIQGLDSRLSSLLRFEAILLGLLVTLLSTLWRAGLWGGPTLSRAFAILSSCFS